MNVREISLKRIICSLLKDLLCTLCFYDVWLFQVVGHEKILINNVKLQSYWNVCNITKIRLTMSRLRLSAHRLCTETGRWTKSNSIPVTERKCLTCNVLEDDNHFVLKYNALL